MKGAIFRAVLASVIMFVVAAPAWAETKVEGDKENVVASRLIGKWEPNAQLTKHLGGEASGKIAFESDAKVVDKIPAKFQAFLQGKRVYMAGFIVRGAKKNPFILIEHHGNPHLVFFRERDGDPYGDAESFNLVIAVAQDTKNDLLFIGGDFNNQPFAAYERVKADD